MPESIRSDFVDNLLAEPVALRPSGVPTTVIGPPTTGDHVADEIWVDAIRGIFRCTVAGTPGTWVQEKPAIVTGAVGPAGAPVNYLIKMPDKSPPWGEFYWDGASWLPVNLQP